jgi:hypothetical protein
MTSTTDRARPDRPTVLSIVRDADVGAARRDDPALDTNAYAVADEVDLTLVLKDAAVDLAIDGVCCDGANLRGVAVPVTEPARDLRALIDSGVPVHAVAEDLAVRGIDVASLVRGIEPLPEAQLAVLIAGHDVTLTTGS